MVEDESESSNQSSSSSSTSSSSDSEDNESELKEQMQEASGQTATEIEKEQNEEGASQNSGKLENSKDISENRKKEEADTEGEDAKAEEENDAANKLEGATECEEGELPCGEEKEEAGEITAAKDISNENNEEKRGDKIDIVTNDKDTNKTKKRSLTPRERKRSRSRSRSRQRQRRRSRSRSHNSRSRSPRRRSRSRSKGRRRRQSRSRSRSAQRRKSHSPTKDLRGRRSESLERRREERKRRHAEREKRERNREDSRDSKRNRREQDQNNKQEIKEKEKETATPRTATPPSVEKAADNDNATVTDPKAKITERQRRTVDLLTSRTGGAYIPPAKLRLMQAEITDKSSAAYQRIAWEALKKSIHGYINKVNVDNIAIITRELLKENIVRGRGLLCRSIIQAQAASPTFTHVYAALVAIINSKFPNIGELLLKRLVIQFKRAFRRNDKAVCMSSSRFIAHLVNQRVAHEILALEILTLLVETPTDDSVEVSIAFLKECGMKLTEVSSKGIGAIFEMLRNILHEGKLEKRVQYMIEVVFQVRKDGFKDHQSVIEALELVEEDDQFTHLMMLDEANDTEDILNVFKFDDQYQDNEEKYKGLSKEILGSDASDSGDSDGSESDTEDSSDSDEDNEEKAATAGDIIDNTETNLIALRRTIYLTINSSLDYEECAHKLMKMQLKPGQEIELCHMFLDCCAEQRTYEKFYGLLAQRFCTINRIYIAPFEEIFKDTYQTTHRLDTNRLRNVSKFFAHLLFTDAIGWDVLECIKLNEDDTTSSSRIFIKILFQELAEYMGLSKLNSKLKDDVLTESLAGLFPKDNPRNTRFAINFFTSIGLGGLTDELRQFLKNAPKSVPAINIDILESKPIKAEDSKSSSSPSSSSSSSTTSSSSSESSSSSSSPTSSSSSDTESSDSDNDKKKRKKKRKTKEIPKKRNDKEKGKSKKQDSKKKDSKKQGSKKQDSKKSKNKSKHVKDKPRNGKAPAVDVSESGSESSSSSSSSEDEKRRVQQRAKNSRENRDARDERPERKRPSSNKDFDENPRKKPRVTEPDRKRQDDKLRFRRDDDRNERYRNQSRNHKSSRNYSKERG